MSATDPETNIPIEHTPSAAASAPVALPGGAPSDSIILIETGVVLLMAVLPRLYTSYLTFSSGASGAPMTIFDDFITDLWHTARITLPLLFIIWRSGERWNTFGIARVRWLHDILLMVATFFVAQIFVWGIRRGLYAGLPGHWYRLLTYSSPPTNRFFHGPRDSGDYLLLIVVCCLVGFNEELLFRGYLIPRFERIFKSAFPAVMLSALLFGAMHIYQGWYGAILSAGRSLVYALFFVRFRRLWPLAAVHAVYDFTAFARLH